MSLVPYGSLQMVASDGPIKGKKTDYNTEESLVGLLEQIYITFLKLESF